MDTNASVNSLASFHAVMGPDRLFIRPACIYSFHTVRAAQPKTS